MKVSKASIVKTTAALAVALLTTPIFAQGSGLAVTVNGQPIAFTGQGPVENGGRVLVPLRGVLEKLGAYVSYDNGSREVRAVRNESQIILPIGARTAQVDGRSVALDAPAQILNGSTMVPLRFVAESLGAHVDYEPATSTVAIRTEAGGGDKIPSRSAPVLANPRRLVRGTILSVHPGEKRLVIQDRNGDRRSINLSSDYRVQRRTPDGNATIDLDRLQPGDPVALEMQAGQARSVTVLPDRAGLAQ